LFFEESTHNRIEDNVIDNSTQDNLALHKSDYNLVVGNTISNAAHTVWVIKCGSHNIIRKNRFTNPLQKIGEIYDCHEAGSEHQFFVYDSTRHNVVEDNVFGGAVKYYSTSGGNGIQYAGQMGIVRRNIFYDCNAGICLQYYEGEAEHNKYNRVYHNVFYKNECGGIAVSGAGDRDIIDNRFINNALYENYSCEKQGEGQIVFRDGPLNESLFRNNCMFSPDGDEIVSELFGSDNTLGSFENSQQEWFQDNISVEPMFVDAENYDFNLKNGSPLIDAGAFLTRTVREGNGTEVPVEDALFFCDGFGMSGVSGDTIRFEGTEDIYVVRNVDYDNSVLTLDRSATWEASAGVTHAFTGERPDIGAFEYIGRGSVGSPGKKRGHSLSPSGDAGEKMQLFNLKGERLGVVGKDWSAYKKPGGNVFHGICLLKSEKSVKKCVW
jgi:parallel beta-helix repeat protein